MKSLVAVFPKLKIRINVFKFGRLTLSNNTSEMIIKSICELVPGPLVSVVREHAGSPLPVPRVKQSATVLNNFLYTVCNLLVLPIQKLPYEYVLLEPTGLLFLFEILVSLYSFLCTYPKILYPQSFQVLFSYTTY